MLYAEVIVFYKKKYSKNPKNPEKLARIEEENLHIF